MNVYYKSRTQGAEDDFELGFSQNWRFLIWTFHFHRVVYFASIFLVYVVLLHFYSLMIRSLRNMRKLEWKQCLFIAYLKYLLFTVVVVVNCSKNMSQFTIIIAKIPFLNILNLLIVFLLGGSAFWIKISQNVNY